MALDLRGALPPHSLKPTPPPPETFHDVTRFPRRSHARSFARPARHLRGLGFLLLPPLSAAERAAERESERELNVVLAEMFGPKGNYNDPEIEAAYAVLDAREKSNDGCAAKASKDRTGIAASTRSIA
jgi:hypothetical protein